VSNVVEVVLIARDQTAADLVLACAKGDLPFSGPNSLWSEFTKRGWSTSCLYEVVRATESAIDRPSHERKSQQ
jgi:hypothetical protein